MKPKPLHLLLAVGMYLTVLFVIYDDYLFAIFEYAHFRHEQRSFLEMATSILLAFIPLAADRNGRSLGRLFSALIYALYYLPAIVITLFSLARPYADVLLLQGCLCLSMAMIFFAGSRFAHPTVEKPVTRPSRQTFSWITLALVAVTVAAYGGHIRIVSFADVYDLRSENADLVNPVIGYFVMWLSYGLLPFVLACGIIYRDRLGLILGLLGCVLIYGATVLPLISTPSTCPSALLP